MSRYRKPYRIKRKRSIAKSRFFWPTIFISIFISIFIISIVYFLFFSQLFQIKKIIISGNQKLSNEEIIRVVEEKFEKRKIFHPVKNIFLVNIKTIKKDILNNFPQIAEIEIKRNFPETLNFTITERIETAIFCRDNESVFQECFLIDKEGVVFERVLENNLQLPKIKNSDLEKELALGQETIEANFLSRILKVFSELENSDILIKEILIISEERINIKTLDDWEIYFNPREDLDWQLIKLEAVLDKYIPLEERKNLEYIDLRFGILAPFKYREIQGIEE